MRYNYEVSAILLNQTANMEMDKLIYDKYNYGTAWGNDPNLE